MLITETIVIGAGGTGGHLIPPLARLLAHHDNADSKLTVVDGDAFEEGNITRQIMGETQIGQNKAEAMKAHCEAQGLAISAKPEYVTEGMIKHMINPNAKPLVVLAVDNDATRKAAINVMDAHLSDFFFVSPGNADDSDGTSPIRGNVVWYGSFEGQAIGINPALAFSNIDEPTDNIPRVGSCALLAPSAPQLIAANALAASLTLAVIQNLLDLRLPADAGMLFFDGRDFKFQFS